MQIDVAYVVVGLMVNQNKLRKVKKIQAKTIKNNLGQNSKLLSQLLCRRTMVGEVVGLRRSNNITEQHITEYYSALQNII